VTPRGGRERAAAGPPIVAFVGCFQDGKSTLINAVLGEECAQVGDGVATTLVPTLYKYGGASAARGLRSRELMVVCRRNDRLKRACLLDTPGLDSGSVQHERVTSSLLCSDRVHFLVLVVGKRAPPSKAHYSLLELARSAGLPFAVVMNTRDWRTEGNECDAKRDDVCRQFEARLKEDGYRPMPVRVDPGRPDRLVWPCVAAWEYPGKRFQGQIQGFKVGSSYSDERLARECGVRELRHFLFGPETETDLPSLISVANVCRMMDAVGSVM
jgi:GTP-binding protein EngB required for normal cell division